MILGVSLEVDYRTIIRFTAAVRVACNPHYSNLASRVREDVFAQALEILLRALSSLKWLQVVCPAMSKNIVPFSCILRFDSTERRKFLCTKLIQTGIYPAILWPLEKPFLKDIRGVYSDASRRMLSIHCDMRYSERDMSYVADRINDSGSQFRG